MKKLRTYIDLQDSDLLAYLTLGSEEAFVEIYSRYKTILFLHARRMLADDELARDVVQEIFTALWTKRNEIQINTSLKSYLFKAVKHKVLNFILHQKHVDKYMNMMLPTYSAGICSTDLAIQESELSRLIEAEIDALPDRMRQAFVLSRKEHLSHRQIAEKMKISEETVKKQIGYALKILRSKFKVLIYCYLLFF